MKVGIVGAGYMGAMHAVILRGLAGVALVGITGKGMRRASELASRMGVRAYADYRELMRDPEIDVVDVCSPTATHAEIACECLAAGKSVIVEYPAFANERELSRVRKASRKARKTCAVAYYSRYQSQYARAFDLAKSGELGRITNLCVSRRSSAVFAGDDIMNDLLAQDIDFMVRLLGTPSDFTVMNAAQDYACALFRYPGAAARVEGATNMPDSFPFTTRHLIRGDAGCLELSWRFTDRPEYEMRLIRADGVTEIRTDDYDPYAFELARIAEGLQKDDCASFDIESVYDSSVLTYACRARMRG